MSTQLGEPISIHEVARMIGSSAWTVRQVWLPKGLPCLRSGPGGKLIFYREQVVAWILTQQQKGGTKL
jgi:hypothetical protein